MNREHPTQASDSTGGVTSWVGPAPGSSPPSRAAAWARASPGVAFVMLAFGFTWLVWIPGFVIDPEAQWPMFLGAFGPAVAAATLVRMHGHSIRGWLRRIVRLRVRARWYAVALLLPLVDTLAQTVLARQEGVSVSLAGLGDRLPLYATSFVLVLLIGGGQEELGWRGWLLPALQERTSALVAALLVGSLHALWHLPLFAFGALSFGETAIVPYLAMVVAGSVVFTWLYNSTHGSVALAMVMHAQLNTASALVPVDDLAGYEATVHSTSIATTLQLVLAGGWTAYALVLVLRHGPRLGAPS